MAEQLANNFTSKKIVVFTGHFGSGKTENAVNYSLAVESDQNNRVNEKTKLIDLDIINPYFRSRELQQLLNDNGVETILPSKQMQQVDFPVIPPQIRANLTNPQGKIIVDLGGNPDGATTMGGFKRVIPEDEYEMWMVVNANRLQTSNLDKTLNLAYQIENAARLKITGIINNTHLKSETTIKDILNGKDLCIELSQKLQVPVVYSAIPFTLQDEACIYEEKIGDYMILDRYLIEPWDI